MSERLEGTRRADRPLDAGVRPNVDKVVGRSPLELPANVIQESAVMLADADSRSVRR